MPSVYFLGDERPQFTFSVTNAILINKLGLQDLLAAIFPLAANAKC